MIHNIFERAEISLDSYAKRRLRSLELRDCRSCANVTISFLISSTSSHRLISLILPHPFDREGPHVPETFQASTAIFSSMEELGESPALRQGPFGCEQQSTRTQSVDTH